MYVKKLMSKFFTAKTFFYFNVIGVSNFGNNIHNFKLFHKMSH